MDCRGPVLIIPGMPPSQNRYWRMAQNRIYTTAAARNYRNMVQRICEQAGLTPAPNKGKVGVWLDCYLNHAARDLVNCHKVILDALQARDGFGLYDDDNQIEVLVMRRYRSPSLPRIEVRVWGLDKQGDMFADLEL